MTTRNGLFLNRAQSLERLTLNQNSTNKKISISEVYKDFYSKDTSELLSTIRFSNNQIKTNLENKKLSIINLTK